ncbi:MAG: DNA repair protein RecN [Thermodesulfovibrionales bacterium]|nr:DNA repair protein RecN [Thermodesulfovibrionales bacterium]
MLRELRIKNFTIIDDLSISFELGFNVLTGETGAGKSIIVDALGLLLGDKASQDMIKAGAKEAQLEVCFDDIGHQQLVELSIENEEGIVIRRCIAPQGKGRAFINDVTVGLQTLSNIGNGIVNIHGQHEHQDLLRKESHLLFLDAFGGLTEYATNLQILHQEVTSLRNNLAEMKNRVRERAQRVEFLRFQIEEIDSASLKIGEKESIEGERSILLNLSKLKEASETAYDMLYESEGSCLEQLSKVAMQIRGMAQIDQSIKGLLEMLDSAIPQIEDVAILLRKTRDKYDMEPKRLEELEDRIELIRRLEKKYGEGIEGILKYRNNAEEELKGLEHIEERQEALDNELTLNEDRLLKMAEELSGKRQSTVKNLEGMIRNELRELGFQKADFKAAIKRRETITANGVDEVEFLFSANPGEPPKPLIKVASGGELSRIMLALKCIEIQKTEKLQTPNPKPRTLIFDEVDAGIGGITAQHVGKRLKDISKNYQVLCITHLPQIAALADHHLRVEKVMVKDSVKVKIEPLKGKERKEELARMLSGRVTDVSLRHAEELLGLTKTTA